MFRIMKLLHFIGLILFLGSILSFILVSTLMEGAALEWVVFGRRIISAGTQALTLPGMWLMAISGLQMAFKRYGVRVRFVQIKALIMLLIVLNAHLLVMPAVTQATALAIQSLAEGQLLPGYHAAYLRESICGAMNVLLTLLAAAVGVWRVGVRPPQRPAAACPA